MLDADRKEFAKIVRATMLVCGGDAPEPDVLRIWWESLQGQTIADVSAAFSLYAMRGKYAPKPADILEILDRIRPDGRPGAEEAWAMVPKDEYASAVITDEMAEAMNSAIPLLYDGDKIGARMAFKEAYTRLVDASKRAGLPVRWFPSLGHDKESRAPALAEGVRLGRIGAEHAIGLLPPEKVAPMLESAGQNKLAIEHKPANSKTTQENLARMKAMIASSRLVAV